MMEMDMAGAGGGWYDGRGFGGGRWREDGADGLVLLELLLEVGVPVVLDVIVGSLRKVRSYGCPPAYIHACSVGIILYWWSITMDDGAMAGLMNKVFVYLLPSRDWRWTMMPSSWGVKLPRRMPGRR